MADLFQGRDMFEGFRKTSADVIHGIYAERKALVVDAIGMVASEFAENSPDLLCHGNPWEVVNELFFACNRVQERLRK